MKFGNLSKNERIKLEKSYSTGPSAYGSSINLQRATGLPAKTVDTYLEQKNSYTKHKKYHKIFPRLKVIAYDINEIWSVDVAYMDKLSKYNRNVKYLLVAVDCLSRYLRVEPLKTKYATEAASAFRKMIKHKQPKKVWVDQGSEFRGTFRDLCDRKKFIFTTLSAKRNLLLLSETYDH